MNLKLLKYLFVYVFTLTVCKISILQSKKQKKDVLTPHCTSPLYAPVRFWADPPPPPPHLPTSVGALWMVPKT